MRKTAIAFALAAAGVFAAAPVFAQDAPGTDSGFFINGSAGSARTHSQFVHGNDFGYSVMGGYRWAVAPGLAIGPEIGYTHLGNMDFKQPFETSGNRRQQSSLHGWMAGVGGRYNFTPNWYVSAHGGLFRWSGYGVATGLAATTPMPMTVADRAHGTDGYGGVGVGYDFNRHVGIGIGYDYFWASRRDVRLPTSLISGQLEYRF